MNKNKPLYFIAIVPSGETSKAIFKWKNYFATSHNSVASLNSPPHITLHMPFTLKVEKELKIIELLHEVASKHMPFSVKLDGFGAFEPRVIYINVVENQPMRELQKSIAKEIRRGLNIFNDEYKNRGFTPHITVAFRDLRKQAFVTAWEKMKTESFKSDFMANEICLLKHNGKCWDVFKKFPLINL